MKDIPRQWHHTHAAYDAKPIFLGLSGIQIAAFLAAICLSMLGLFVMTQLLKIQLLTSLVIAAAFPALTLGVLRKFYTGKPKGFAARWVEYQQIKKSKSPLLSHISKNEKF